MKKILCLLFLLQIGFAQSLLPVYEGKVKPKFELVWEIGGEEGKNDIIISNPRYLYVDYQGNLYYAEYSGEGIFKFDKNGNLIKKIGCKGSGPGEFNNCFKMSFDIEGNYYLYDIRNRRVSIFNSKDEFVKSFNQSSILHGMEYLGQNKFVIAFDKYEDKNEYGYRNRILNMSDSNFDTILPFDSLYYKATKKVKKGEQILSVGVVYSPNIDYRILKNGNIFSVNSDEYSVKIFDRKGKLISQKKFGEKKIRVSQREIDEIIKPFKEDPRNKDFKDLLEVNEVKPFYEYVLNDAEGYILVKKYTTDEKHVYDVFNPKGDFINSIELSEQYFDYGNVISNGFVYSVETNDDDLRVIRKYKIIL